MVLVHLLEQALAWEEEPSSQPSQAAQVPCTSSRGWTHQGSTQDCQHRRRQVQLGWASTQEAARVCRQVLSPGPRTFLEALGVGSISTSFLAGPHNSPTTTNACQDDREEVVRSTCGLRILHG